MDEQAQTELENFLFDKEDSNISIINQFYTPIQFLGKGSFSVVILAYDQISQTKVAIKVMEKNDTRSNYLDAMRKEAKVMDSICHPNIVRMKFSKETKNKFYIVMDWIDGVTLEQYFPQLEDISRLQITKQILSALQYLHSKDIVHRDLKPENIMITESNSELQVTIIDFGLSADVSFDYGLLKDNCGTYLYMAPEVILRKVYNRSIDIWAVGVIVYNMFFQGKHPFFEKRDTKQSYADKMKFHQRVLWPESIDIKVKNFINKTMHYLPENRLTAEQCLQHPWISGTGNINDPVTLIDLISKHSAQIVEKKLDQIIRALVFINYLQKSNQDNQNNVLQQSFEMDQTKFKIDDYKFNTRSREYSLDKSIDSKHSNNTKQQNQNYKSSVKIRPIKNKSSQLIKVQQSRSIMYDQEKDLFKNENLAQSKIIMTEGSDTSICNMGRKSSSLNQRLFKSQISIQMNQQKIVNSTKQIRLPQLSNQINLQQYNKLYQQRPPIAKKSVPEKLATIAYSQQNHNSNSPSPLKQYIQRSYFSKKSNFNF